VDDRNKNKGKYAKLLGEVIYEIRKSKGKSQRDFAEDIGCSGGYVTKLENGLSIPRDPELINNLDRIITDYSVYYLIEYTKSQKRSVSVSKELPNILEFLKTLLERMPEHSLSKIVLQVELRIGLFREDKKKLADNVKRFLLGDLRLNDIPENGLRPLCHYLDSWGPEIEKWTTSQSGIDGI